MSNPRDAEIRDLLARRNVLEIQLQMARRRAPGDSGLLVSQPSPAEAEKWRILAAQLEVVLGRLESLGVDPRRAGKATPAAG